MKWRFPSFSPGSNNPGSRSGSNRTKIKPLNFCRVLDVEGVHSYFEAHREACAPIAAPGELYRGRCYVCQSESNFEVHIEEGSVNWRETLKCQGCQLINRWRSCLHLFEEICTPNTDTKIFITEAVTPLYDLIRAKYAATTGSEFSPSATSGEQLSIGDRQVVMQDVTRLTLPDNQFDCVLTFDVLEHVPNYKLALREFRRVLKSGGHMLLSAPFTFEAETKIRAIVEKDGSIRHLLPPEYHGDPMSDSGVLCYQTFGMDLLAELEGAGFDRCFLCCYTSSEWAYLGPNILFVAQKP
jgi:SAM-dependent methyltransferase